MADKTPEELAREIEELRQQLADLKEEAIQAAQDAGKGAANEAVGLFDEQIKALPQTSGVEKLVRKAIEEHEARHHTQTAETAPAAKKAAIPIPWWGFVFVVPVGALILAFFIGGMLTQIDLAWGFNFSTYVLSFFLLLILGYLLAIIIARFPAKTKRPKATEPLK